MVAGGATLLLAGAGVWLGIRGHGRNVGPMREVAVRSADIAFFEARVERDTLSAADMAQLAALYLQRSRETGDREDVRRSEQLARRSLALRSDRNSRAWLVLTSSLLAQHRFAESRSAAESLVVWDSTPGHMALLGEIELEMGRYTAARRIFDSLRSARRNLAVAPRLARWQEIVGRPEEAHALLVDAATEADRRTDLPREQVAWFHLRVADIALRFGRLREARAAIARGLAVEPNDFRLLAAMARWHAVREQWRAAVSWGLRAAAAGGDMQTLDLVGDAFAALGNHAEARRYLDRADSLGVHYPEPFNRQWTLFRLDHSHRVNETRELLEQEILERQDVYGWDQLAWARYRTGDMAGARLAIGQALSMGTRDAVILYHAGVIAEASGRRIEARSFLEQALRTNPYFHWRQAADARERLRRLAG